MIRRINVHFLPSWISPDHLADRTVVVVDVLRATTTIVYALAHGAKEVIPCLTVEDAWQAYRGQAGPVVLGGERGGLAVEGFHLGNSPNEYTTEAIGGKCEETVEICSTVSPIFSACRGTNTAVGSSVLYQNISSPNVRTWSPKRRA